MPSISLTRELERQPLPNAVPRSPPSNTAHIPRSTKAGQGQGADKSGALTAISVRERAQQSLEDTDGHLKAIDVSVIPNKPGDIKVSKDLAPMCSC